MKSIASGRGLIRKFSSAYQGSSLKHSATLLMALVNEPLKHELSGCWSRRINVLMEKELQIFQPIIAKLLQEMDKPNTGEN